jgi:hypothetical protein
VACHSGWRFRQGPGEMVTFWATHMRMNKLPGTAGHPCWSRAAFFRMLASGVAVRSDRGVPASCCWRDSIDPQSQSALDLFQCRERFREGDFRKSYCEGCSQPVGVECEICSSSSVISAETSAKSGVLK